MYNTKYNILKNPLPCEAMHQDTQRTIFSVLPKIEMIKILRGICFTHIAKKLILAFFYTSFANIFLISGI